VNKASDYRVPPLRQLKDQLLFAPKPLRIEQTGRAERFLGEIEESKRYPYDLICYRVTNFRPSKAKTTAFPGSDVKHDLLRFISDLSDSVDLRPDMIGEPVIFLEELAKQYSVSTKTVSRWRKRGLVARRFRSPNGRRRLGFLKSSVDQFVTSNRRQVNRSSRFRTLTASEKEDVVLRARRMARYSRCCVSEIARRIAKKMGRAPETIRYTIRDFDKQHPDDAVFRNRQGRLDKPDKEELYRSFQRGVPVGILGRRFCRTPSSIYRIVNEVRAWRLLDLDMSFMDSEEFHKPGAKQHIMTPVPQADPNDRRTRTQKAPAGLPPYLAHLYTIPLLNREQEAHLFRQMNYLKFRVNRLRDRLDPLKARSPQILEIQRLADQALATKNRIIRSNLRLVVSIAKRHVGQKASFFELVSDGNMSLLRAVEKFNYSLGNKFSTYASWAIMKNFARTIPEENYRQDRFLTGHEEMFEAAADTRDDGQQYEAGLKRIKKSLETILVKLDERERRIIVSRFGLDDSRGPETLEQVGQQFGVTKERIRQIQARALNKLKKFADEAKLDIASL